MQQLGENPINTPAFLGKLWKMVNDPSTDHLISWSAPGNSFVIQNQAQFWYELLPLYYKHNNMSSFVRQLNMYGFHKLSTVENGTMDTDKDEIQFTHPFFQKDQPELLRNIKRKATTSKSTVDTNSKHDELEKVLLDVKQLRGRQVSVDSQLIAMKQENALLWREVALLRQKHLKQQKIVNKLIQFLVTLVQPSRMTMGVKRRYQLMLNESPAKKPKVGPNKSGNMEGPTIHELDSELDLAPSIYDDVPLAGNVEGDVIVQTIESPQQVELNSPAQVATSEPTTDETPWDKRQLTVEDLRMVDAELNEDSLMTLEGDPLSNNSNDKVFLNPAAQNTLLSNLIKNVVCEQERRNETDKAIEKTAPSDNSDMTVATRDSNLCDIIKSLPSTSDAFNGELNTHVESAQNELDQFKDILNNYNSLVDANALLGELNMIPQNIKDEYLFQDEAVPVYDLNVSNIKNDNLIDSDPMVSGSELTPYAGNFDFNELLDDSIDADNTALPPINDFESTSVETPQILKEELIFPTIEKK